MRLRDVVEKLEALTGRSELAATSLEEVLSGLNQALHEASELLASQRPAGRVTDESGQVRFELSRPITLDQLEAGYIRHVLRDCHDNRTHAAERLGIDPSTLYRRLAKFLPHDA